MHLVFIAQSIDQDYVNQIIESLPESCSVTLLTGRDINLGSNHLVIRLTSYDITSFKSRAKSWLAFAKEVDAWRKANKNISVDLIYAVSNPPLNSFLGLRMKKTFNAPFVYMEWDIYPQIIKAQMSGLLPNLVYKIWSWKNQKILPSIDLMLTLGDVMKQSITNPVKRSVNVRVAPLAAKTNTLQPISHDKNPFLLENNLADKFIVLYSGKMGLGHNIPIILDAAEKLSAVESDIVFVFIGQGPGYKLVEEQISVGIANVRLFPLQPDDIFPYSMASGDVGVVSQEANFAKLFLPSKTFDMMACGMPIIGICSDEDDLGLLIENEQVGVAIKSNNANDLADAVMQYFNNRDLCKTTGKRARALVEEKYSREKVVALFREIFSEYLSMQRK